MKNRSKLRLSLMVIISLYSVIVLGQIKDNVIVDSPNDIFNPTLKTTIEAYESITFKNGAHIRAVPYGLYRAYIVSDGLYTHVDDHFNWTHNVIYDNKGNVISSSRNYFNDLGKSTLSLSQDFQTGKIWGSETIYDDFGRVDKTSFSTIISNNSFQKVGLLSESSSTVPYNIVTGIFGDVIQSPNLQYYPSYKSNLIDYYSDNNQYEAYQATAEYPYTQSIYDTELNPGKTLQVIGGNKINGEWKTGFSYTMPATQEMYYVYGSDNFYDERNVDVILQHDVINSWNDFSEYYVVKILNSEADVLSPEVYGVNVIPFLIRSNNKQLEIGKIYSVLSEYNDTTEYVVKILDYYSGPQPLGEFKVISIGFDSYKELETQEKLTQILQDSNNIIAVTKFNKSVSIDSHGVENVSFSDGEGKVLANARSGGPTQYPITSLIGEQGFVDIHIPVGCDGTTEFIGLASEYKVFNLRTGKELFDNQKNNLGAGFYRVEVIDKSGLMSLTYINKVNGTIHPVSSDPKGIKYNVNYYDYSVNIYNKTGQLERVVQPNGYQENTTIVAEPAHMKEDAVYVTTYRYNNKGQLEYVKSPDEGNSQYKYRKDGQIRYSQNSLQAKSNKVSYTNYDTYARPIESGVLTDVNFNDLNPDTDLPSGIIKSEQNSTIYDYVNNTQGLTTQGQQLETILNWANIPEEVQKDYKQTHLSGNVVTTYNEESQTWYSYDIYGRLKWTIQYIPVVGAKTIHYKYDAQGNVKQVIYQKDKVSEYFAHQYTYNLNGALTKVRTTTDKSQNTHSWQTQAEYKYYIDGKLKRVELADGIQGIDYVYTLGGALKSINHPSLSQDKDPGGDSNDVFGLTLDYYSGDYIRSGTQITTSDNVTSTTGYAYNKDQYDGTIKAVRWSNSYDQTPKAYAYQYNRNNWLTNAKFGELKGTDPKQITPLSQYNEGKLTYDANGNIQTLYRTNDQSQVTDELSYIYKEGKNQLQQVTDSQQTDDPSDIEGINTYQYNAIGQLIENEGEATQYIYNTHGLVTEVHHHNVKKVAFFYDEKGQRIKKVGYDDTGAINNTDYYIRDLSGNVLSIYNRSPLTGNQVTQIELPLYGGSRLGVYNKGLTANSYQYQITDHLGNVRAVISNVAGKSELQNYADYYPFGERLPQRDALGNYRYAFQGQELDVETGKEAFQLRLWDGRIGRWLTTDPYGEFYSPYLGMGNNPISLIDPDGGKTEGKTDWIKNLITNEVKWFQGVGKEAEDKALKEWGIGQSDIKNVGSSYFFTMTNNHDDNMQMERQRMVYLGEISEELNNRVFGSRKKIDGVAQDQVKQLTYQYLYSKIYDIQFSELGEKDYKIKSTIYGFGGADFVKTKIPKTAIIGTAFFVVDQILNSQDLNSVSYEQKQRAYSVNMFYTKIKPLINKEVLFKTYYHLY